MKTRQSKRLHNQNVGTTKPERRSTGSASTVLFRIISENIFMRQEIYSRNSL